MIYKHRTLFYKGAVLLFLAVCPTFARGAYIAESVFDRFIMREILQNNLMDVSDANLEKITRGAENGNADACYKMAIISYIVCFWVEKDDGSAFMDMHRFFADAAKQNHIKAKYCLCWLDILGALADNKAGTPELKKAMAAVVKQCQALADAGLDVAQYSTGMFYYNGEWVTEDAFKAEKYFRMAADQGLAEGQYGLALCSIDDKKAFEWFLKSAKQDFPIAQYELGCMYRDGTGVAKNRSEAERWLRKAAEQKYQKAKDALNSL